MKMIYNSGVIYGNHNKVTQEVLYEIYKSLFKIEMSISFKKEDSVGKLYLLNFYNQWTEIFKVYLYDHYKMQISYSEIEEPEIKNDDLFKQPISDMKQKAIELSSFIIRRDHED